MNAPPIDYMNFWIRMLAGSVLAGVVLFVLLAAIVVWLFCGLIVIGGLRKRTWRRVLVSLTAGPLLLRDSGFRN